MKTKEKKTSQRPKPDKFFLRPFLRYFKPHVWRLGAAFLAMSFVSFFGAFNILLLKPPLEILFGLGNGKKDEASVKKALDENRDGIIALGPFIAGSPPEIQSVLKPISDIIPPLQAQQKSKDNDKVTADSEYDKIAIVRWFKATVDKNFSPIRNAVTTRWTRFSDWMVANPKSALWVFSAALLIMYVMRGFFEYFSRYLMAVSLFQIILAIKQDIYRHVMKQDFAYFVKQTTGTLENRISSDVGRIKTIFEGLIQDGVQQPLNVVAIAILLVIISPQLTLVALGGLVFCFLPMMYFGKKLKKVTQKSKKKEDELSSIMEESLRNFRVVKIFNTEEYELSKFRNVQQALFKYSINRRMARFASSPITDVIGAMAASVVLILGGSLILGVGDRKPLLEPIEFILYLILVSRVYTPMRKLSRLNLNWQVAKVSAERMLEMLALEPKITEMPNALPIQRLERGIEMRDVHFSYGRKEVLKGIDFRLERGKVVALVGRSGAGKSTIANLLPRLMDPQSGAIEFDGSDAREYKVNDLRRLFGVVTQETVLFNDTVAANIGYGDDKIDEERLKAAAQAAYAEDFILKLSSGKGYQSIIGQGGQQLSGGQRQRLAIARAIYRDPQVLIFDEATSSLDQESESAVQKAIDNLLKGRTAIIIAHRLSTIRYADEILVLDEGRIVERGPHDALLAKQGEYWKLYRAAARKPEDAA